jgi:hypothetical protein
MTNRKPELKAILLCDQVVADDWTKKLTIVGLFTHVRVPSFPDSYGPVCVFIRLANGEGSCELRLRLTHVPTGNQLGEAVVPAHLTNHGRVADFAIRLPMVTIDAPGEHEFRVEVDQEVVGSTTFTVSKLEN